jgi:hypothetical protein
MDEKEQAKHIASMWLDGRMNSLVQMIPGDPDCDAYVLARQYLRALDAIDDLRRPSASDIDPTAGADPYWNWGRGTKALLLCVILLAGCGGPGGCPATDPACTQPTRR